MSTDTAWVTLDSTYADCCYTMVRIVPVGMNNDDMTITMSIATDIENEKGETLFKTFQLIEKNYSYYEYKKTQNDYFGRGIGCGMFLAVMIGLFIYVGVTKTRLIKRICNG